MDLPKEGNEQIGAESDNHQLEQTVCSIHAVNAEMGHRARKGTLSQVRLAKTQIGMYIRVHWS